MYRTGDGVIQNIEFADHLQKEFQRAAKQSDWSREDHMLLASMFIRGGLLPRDLVAASDRYYCIEDKATSLKFMLQAVDEGDPRALERLGQSYKGIGWPITEINKAKSDEYYAQAAKLRKEALATQKVGTKNQTRKQSPFQGDEEFHLEQSKKTKDPIISLYHLVWVACLRPRC